MKAIFEALRDGDHSIVDKFAQANSEWNSILKDIETVSVEDLAKRLGSAQYTFEHIAGERHLGKLLCGLSGFTHLYSCQVGLDNNRYKARKLRDAFAQSFCSVEVKHFAREAAEEYGVD